jgi:hypothetical protein
VQDFWAATQARFPNAQLLLSSLDDFALAILPIAETLPQVTGEIGQSWSYGAPADPAKVAAYRAARRVRNDAIAAGWLDATDTDLYAYERRLWIGGPQVRKTNNTHTSPLLILTFDKPLGPSPTYPTPPQ